MENDRIWQLFVTILEGQKKRDWFKSQIRNRLARFGVSLVGLDLGRDTNHAIWILTIRLQGLSIFTLHVSVRAGCDVFGSKTEESVASRVVRFLCAKRLLSI